MERDNFTHFELRKVARSGVVEERKGTGRSEESGQRASYQPKMLPTALFGHPGPAGRTTSHEAKFSTSSLELYKLCDNINNRLPYTLT